MREFRSVSASQLYDFRDCRRLWWFKSVLGLDTPVRASAELGTAVHAVMQAYLEDGKPPPDTEAGRIFRPAMSLLPPPGTVWTEVTLKDEESSWPRPAIDGTPCNGFVDVLDLVNDGRDYPRVIDLKTTSALKWAKTEADLEEDPQGLIYGKFALDAAAQGGCPSDRVEFGHVVVLTRGGPLAKKTTVTLTRDHIDGMWKSSLEPDVREMREVAKVREADAVPGNRESCNKYGGCHFRDRCRALGMAVDGEVPAFIARRFDPASVPGDRAALARAVLDATREPLTPAPSPAMSGVHVPASNHVPAPEPPLTTSPTTIDPMAALKALKAKKAAEAAAGGAPAQPGSSSPAPENPRQPTAPPADAGSAGEAKPSDAARASILAKYGIKPKASAPAEEAAGANGIVPGDAPPQVSRLATGEAGTKAASGTATGEAGANGAAQAAGGSEPPRVVPVPRKPPGFAAKLAALQWTAEQVARMHPDAMRTAIEGKLDGRGYSVRNDGTIYQPGVGEVAGTPEPAGKGTPEPAGKPDGTTWYYHAESDSFAALTYAQWDASSEKGLLVHVGDDAAKAECEAFLEADRKGHTVEPSPRVLTFLHVLAASTRSPEAGKVAPTGGTGEPAESSPAAREVAAGDMPEEHPAWPGSFPKLVLYVDCVPEKGRDRPYRLLEELVAPLLPVAVEMHNRSTKKDEEKADFYSLIPYNRGPGYVASLLLKSPPTGVLVCNTRMPATSACLEVLVPMADVVVRAIR